MTKKVNELRRAKHENIVKLIAFGKWQDKMDVFNCMVIELADVGSLHHGTFKISSINLIWVLKFFSILSSTRDRFRILVRSRS